MACNGNKVNFWPLCALCAYRMCSFQLCRVKIECLTCALRKESRWLVDLWPRTKCYREPLQTMTASGEPSIDPLAVELDESNIPGAMLSPPFECHRVPELKWWLLCWGIRPAVSMKPQLIARYALLEENLYIRLNAWDWVKILNSGFTKLCLTVQK